MKNFKIFFYFIIIACIVLLHLLAYRTWIFSTGFLTQGDWSLELPSYAKSFLSIPIIWKTYLGGSIDLTPPFYPFLLIEGILANLGLTDPITERVIFMWPIAIFTIPISFIFIKSFTKSSIAALIGSLVYAYNTYFLIIQSGQLTLMAAYAFAPLFLFFLKKSLENKSYLYAILAGLVGFVVSFYEFRGFYMLTIIAGIFYVYFIFTQKKIELIATFKKTIPYMFVIYLIVFLLNIYWIFPVIFGSLSLLGAVFDRGLFGSFYDVSTASTLFHPFWNDSKYLPFIIQPLPFYFFIYPILAFLGAFLNRHIRYVAFFSVLSLIGIFLTKQNTPPFPNVYIWLYYHIPGFNAFRESSKFYFIVALGYSVLIGLFFDWIINNWKKGTLAVLKYLFIFVTISLILLNIKPLITGEFGTLFVTRNMPKDYILLNSFIEKQNDYFRTLWVPMNSRWGLTDNTHPAVGLAAMVITSWQKFSANTPLGLGEQYLRFLRSKPSEELINNTSFKYIIVPLEDKANDDNFYPEYGKAKSDYINQINKMPYLKKINLPLKSVFVYENSNYKPHIYMTSSKENIQTVIPYKRVKSSMINPSQYKIVLNHIKNPFYLNFTDNYHPGWRIRVGKFNWYSVFTSKNYFLPQSIHFKNMMQLNSYYIDPQDIKRKLNPDQYTINSDGTISMNLTLYFAPQSYADLGFIISIFSAIGIIVLAFILLFKKYEKNN